MLDKFINSDSLTARLVRTIFQNLLGIIVANAAIFGGIATQDPQLAAIITAVVVCIASPVMALFKSKNPEDGDTTATAE